MEQQHDDKGVDVTLAPSVGHAEMEFRRDTGIYSSEELSTPADFQRSREYHSPYYSGRLDLGDTAGILGPSSGLGGRQPAQSWTDGWPETPDGSYSDLPSSGRPSYVTEARGGGRRQGDKYHGDQAVDLECKLADLQRQMTEIRRELTPSATPGLPRDDRSTTGADRIRQGQTGSLAGSDRVPPEQTGFNRSATGVRRSGT